MALDGEKLLQLGLLAGLGYLMWRGGCCGIPARPPRRAPGRQEAGAGGTDPLRILQLRLARGEIDVEEYERLRARLVAESGREEART